MHDKPRAADVSSVSVCYFYMLTRDDFKAVLRHDSALNGNSDDNVESRMREVQDRRSRATRRSSTLASKSDKDVNFEVTATAQLEKERAAEEQVKTVSLVATEYEADLWIRQQFEEAITHGEKTNSKFRTI